MCTPYVPVMPCEKMAVTDMFRKRAVIEFLVKEGNTVGVICERLSETRRQNMEWHYTTSPKKKPKTVPSAGKVMGTVFWKTEGCMLVDFLEKGETINAARYV